MAAAALTCQPKLVQGSTLCRQLDVIGKVHQLRVSRPPLLATILLNKPQKLLPLAGNREIARIAADRNWEIHCVVLLVCERQFVFRRLEQ